MSLREGTPGQWGQRRPEHFSYTPTPPGSRPWTAWAANRVYWCLTHKVDDYTKPCLHWITNGELTCVHCKPTRVAPWRGYLACWRQSDLKACMVTLCEENCELAEGIEFGTYITISRVEGEGNPLVVRKLLKQEPWKSKAYRRRSACDLTPSLLTLWGLPVLTAWHEAKFGDSGVSLPTQRRVAVKDDGSPFGPMEQAAAIRAGAQTTSDPATLAEYDRVLQQLKNTVASKNGKHDPDGG